MDDDREMQAHQSRTVQQQEGKLELIAHRNFESNPELVYVVDFLNKSLKSKGIMFGLTRDKDKNQMMIKIYEF